jgi:hypothetical protein
MEAYKMGEINKCPYCDLVRDENKICCRNWKIVLQIEDLFLPESQRPIREKTEGLELAF